MRTGSGKAVVLGVPCSWEVVDLTKQICATEVPQIACATVEHSFQHVQREALGHLRLNLRRHRQFHSINNGIDQDWALMCERRRETRLNLLRTFEPDAAHADRFGHLGKVRILEVRPRVQESRRLLFELNKSERAVVKNDDLEGKAKL